MASPLRTKLRIAASVLFATGFWDAVAGRFLFQRGCACAASNVDGDEEPAPSGADIMSGLRDLCGALHIHSSYSDGLGDVPAIMDAAREAGVDWVLLTDHNTQQPLRDGWEARFARPRLVIGTEVTVGRGEFLLALDMPPEWEPIKELPPQEAVDAVNAHGGLPLISLPFDVKHPWLDWSVRGYEGLEVINLSTVARRHINLLSLLWLLPLYRKRGALACLRALVTRPDQELALWDALTRGGRRMVGIGSLDAHALMKIGRKKYPIPSYADSFRALTTHVLVPEAEADGPCLRCALHDALRAGRCYMAYECLGDPTGFTFTAAGAAGAAGMGERIALGPDGVALTARVPDGERVLLRLLKDGKLLAARSGREGLRFTAAAPGVYRIEAYRYARRIGPFFLGARPWIFSNPIYVA